MNASDFIELFSQTAPNVEQLIQQGFPLEYARREVNGYSFHPLSGIQIYEDPLLDLCHRFQISGVLPFNLELFSPREFVLYWEVGILDGEKLTLDKQTGNVQVEEYGLQRRYVIYPCAANGSAFLDALIFCVPFYYSLAGAFEPNDVINQASTLAGGERFRPFFTYFFEPL